MAQMNSIENPVLLAEAVERVQMLLLAAALDGSSIPYLVKDREDGEFMKVYMGYSVYGSDVYVDKSDLERARDILAGCTSGEEQMDGGELKKQAASQAYSEPEQSGRDKLFRFVIIAVVALFAIALLLYILN